MPVIAVINGKCYGGATQVILGVDFRFSNVNAEYSIMEIKWGLIPDMGGLLGLREILKKDQAMKLTMTGEIIKAKDALSLGLVTSVSTDPLAQANEFCEQLISRSPDAISGIKKVMNKSWCGNEAILLYRETKTQIKVMLGKNFKKALKINSGDDSKFEKREYKW